MKSTRLKRPKRDDARSELAARDTQQSTIAELGQIALTIQSPERLMDEVAKKVAPAFSAEGCCIFEFVPEKNAFTIKNSLGMPNGDVIESNTETSTNSQAAFTQMMGTPIVSGDLPSERRFHVWQGLLDAGYRRSLSVLVPGAVRPYGVLAIYSTRTTSFSSHDVLFAQTVANLLACCIERHQSETHLRKTLHELSTIKYALDEASIVAVTDRQGTITYANKKFCEISKYSEDELIGQNHRILNSGHHSKEFFKDLWQTIAHGKVWRGEIKNRAKDGSSYWVDTTIVPLLDASGKPTQYIAIRNDLSEKKRLEGELTRASQLSLIGELAAGLAHEIKNPLAGIQGAVDILIRRREAGDPERVALESVRHEVTRIDATVRALLERARPRSVHPKVASLTDAVRRAVLVARDHALFAAPKGKEPVHIVFDPPDDPVEVWIDQTLIEDAVLNLLLNAIQASDDGQPVVVTVRTESRDESEAREIMIDVQDFGCGIGEADLGKIFQAFYTTSTDGTGLGLPAVRRIARAHGGRLNVESKLGAGSTFTFRIPRRTHDPRC